MHTHTNLIKLGVTITLFFGVMDAPDAQKRKDGVISVAITNRHTAMPFGKLASLAGTPLHPGVEFSYGFNWRTKKKHDWFQVFSAGYYQHRFVQHGLPLYSSFGYRYKFSSRIYSEASVGLGYLHSVPAAAKFRLGSDGTYHNGKGIGTAQFMAAFNLGAGYRLGSGKHALFATWQQQVQAPYVRSYVPVLPYNVLMLGIKTSIRPRAKTG